MRHFIHAAVALSVLFIFCFAANAQIKYQDGRLLFGPGAAPIGYYPITIAGGGVYFNHTEGRFLQISVLSTGAPHLA